MTMTAEPITLESLRSTPLVVMDLDALRNMTVTGTRHEACATCGSDEARVVDGVVEPHRQMRVKGFRGKRGVTLEPRKPNIYRAPEQCDGAGELPEWVTA